MKTIITAPDGRKTTRYECDTAECDVAIEVDRTLRASSPPAWGDMWGLAPDPEGSLDARASAQSNIIFCPTHWVEFARGLKPYHRVRS